MLDGRFTVLGVGSLCYGAGHCVRGQGHCAMEMATVLGGMVTAVVLGTGPLC